MNKTDNPWVNKWYAAKDIPLTKEQRRDPVVQQLQVHAEQQTGITIDYKEPGLPLHTKIVVYPESVFRKSGYKAVYFSAFSDLHGEISNFRVDRVRNVYTPTETQDAPNYVAQQESSSSKCFIATCVYESEDSWQVNELRSFRDTMLLKSRLGRTLIRFYEFLGPLLASLIGRSTMTKRLTRFIFSTIILPFILLITNDYHNDNNKSYPGPSKR